MKPEGEKGVGASTGGNESNQEKQQKAVLVRIHLASGERVPMRDGSLEMEVPGTQAEIAKKIAELNESEAEGYEVMEDFSG